MHSLKEVLSSLSNKYLKWWKYTADEKNINGSCPFHQESSEGAFYISTETGLYICHSCLAKGNLYNFMRELGVSSRYRNDVLKYVGDELNHLATNRVRKSKHKKCVLDEMLLGVFDYCPKPLLSAGFKKDLLKKHEVGFDLQHKRITFPIRDHLGNLVGISGRTVINERPKYKIYKDKELSKFSEKYNKYEFEKKYYLWNMHNVYPKLFFGNNDDPVLVVEGYKAALWAIQAGFENTVALMGTYLSTEQETLLSRLKSKIYIMLDNTLSATEGAENAASRLFRTNRVYLCVYPETSEVGDQPDNLTPKELWSAVNNAPTFYSWRTEYAKRCKNKVH